MRRYRELLAVPGVLRLTFAVLLSRVSTAMLNLALLVATTQAHGYAEAGLLMMAFALTNAVLGPVRGRLADRFEPRVVLLALLAGHLLAYTGLMLGLATSAPTAVLYPLAVALGMSVPPTGPIVRGLWPNLVAADRLPTAYAFDATLNNATFVSGPALAGGLLLVLPAYGVVAITGCVKLVGDVLVAAAPALGSRPDVAGPSARGFLGPLAVGRVRLLLTMVGLDAFAYGCLEVTAVAAAGAQGSAGLFTSALALGSAVSGMVYGARTWSAPARSQLVGLHAGAAGVLAVGTLVGPTGFGLVLLGTVFLGFGLLTGPSETLQQVLVGELTPAHQRIEAFAWLFSMLWAGFGLGTTVAGQLAGTGRTAPVMAVAAGAELAIVGLAAVGLRRRPPRRPP